MEERMRIARAGLHLAEHLGIPPEVHVAAMIPIGYPKDKFGPVTRRPPEEVTHWDRWGARQPFARE